MKARVAARAAWGLLLGVLAGGGLRAQVLPFEVLGGEAGIPQSQVTHVVQDGKGFLWVATWGGLARFDGRDFQSFFVEDGLPSNRVAELLAARDGTLWAATAAGLGRSKGGYFEEVTQGELGGARCRALCEDATGRVWIGTDRGLFVGGQGAFRRPEGSERWRGRVYDLLPVEGGILVVSAEGLFQAGVGSFSAVEGPPVSPRSFRCAEKSAEGLWLGTQGEGLWRRQDSGWVELSGFRGWNLGRLRRGTSGTLYACSAGRGLVVFPPGSNQPEIWDHRQGVPSEVVNDAFEDREGTLWVATDIGGLARLSTRAAVRFGREDSFPDPCVFGITLASSPGELWAGTLRGAVRFRPLPRLEVREVLTVREGLPSDLVWKVLEEPGGPVWFLTDEGLARRLRPGEPPSAPAGIPEMAETYNDILLDGQGRLWLVGEDRRGGLALRLPDGSWRRWARTAEGDPLTTCRTLALRRSGGVWVSTDQGLAVSDGTLVSSLPGRPPLQGYVSSLLEDRRGRLWAGNDAGLARREPDGAWTSLNGTPGFTNRTVYFLGEDSRGVVWAGSARGIFLFQERDAVRHLTPEDGLAGLESNMGGFLAEPGGPVWAGGVSGLTRMDPGLQDANGVPPPLAVEEVLLEDGTSIPFPEEVRLPWPHRSAAFRVAVLSFRNPNRCAYRARMEGVEQDWTPLRPAGELRYTLLPPGRRTLFLQAVNDSGLWGEVVRIPVEVVPPFWMTTSFRWSAVAGLVFCLAAAYRWRVRLLHRRGEELRRLVSERTRELEEANRSLERLATMETMTGLFNRRAILQKLREILPPKGQTGRRFGLILLDLDRFKAVNDTLGHAAGDQVLAVFARRIQETLREGDHMGRFGGDEFLLILPGADLEAVQAVGRRLAALEEIFASRGRSLSVTTSAGGLAVRGSGGLDEGALLARADALMYEVKRAGGKGFKVEEVP